MLRRAGLTATMASAMLCAAACGQSSPAVETEVPASPTPTPPPEVMPEWFPEEFPPPPESAEFNGAELTESALVRFDPFEDVGTVVHHSVRLAYGQGLDDELDEVIDHYRAAFLIADWEITEDETEVDPAAIPRATAPGQQIRVEGYDYTGVVTVYRRDEFVEASLSTMLMLTDRAPYFAHEPFIAVPEWYAALPPAPEEIRRYKISVEYDESATRQHLVEYEDDSTGDREGRAVEVIDYYRELLPSLGWQIVAEEDTTEEADAGGGWRRVVLEITGHGVSAEVRASQPVYDSGAWSGVRLSVLVDD